MPLEYFETQRVLQNNKAFYSNLDITAEIRLRYELMTSQISAAVDVSELNDKNHQFVL